MLFLSCILLCFRARLFIDALWSPVGKGLTSWLSFVMSKYQVVTLPLISSGIVSIPDLCPFSYIHYQRNMPYLNEVQWIYLTCNVFEILTKPSGLDPHIFTILIETACLQLE